MRTGTIACVVWLCACTAQPEWSTATLSLRELQGCELPELGRVMLRAGGDFASEQRTISASERATLEQFPPSTRWLTVEAEFEGGRAGGLVPLQEAGTDQARDVLLLPFARACPLGDPLLGLRAGVALAALPNGELLIVGGESESGDSSAAAVLLPAGRTLVEQVPDGTLLRRAGASATVVGDEVLVAGGGAYRDGPAHDVFEVYDARKQRFDRGRSGTLAGGPRRDHGAARLAGDQVLLAGGVSERGGAPLASAELVEVALRSARTLEGELVHARVVPELLTLDDGTLLVALGHVPPDDENVLELERFDPRSEGFEVVATLPRHAVQAVAALEGRRLAYLGCDPGEACELWLLLPEGQDFVLRPSGLALDGELEGLERVRMLGLRDGRLLVTGSDPSAEVSRRAFVVDLTRARVERLAEVSRVPSVLLEVADGSVLELDEVGASLRRLDLVGSYDDAPDPVIGKGAARVVLDLAARWDPPNAEGLRALEPARFDVAHLRFAELEVGLELEGQAELLLEPELAPALVVEIAERSIGVSECVLERATSGEPWSIQRTGTRLRFSSGSSRSRARTCELAALEGHVGLALRTLGSALVRSLHVRRK